MINNFKIITLCGSTKFKNKFEEVQRELTLKGNIVLSVGFFSQSEENITIDKNTKKLLDNLHKAKIDLADEVFIINPNNYIGESTKTEIEYAKQRGIGIKYLEEN